MCGISVVVGLASGAENYDSPAREELTAQMQASLDMINHRGPDSDGIWISSDNRIVLGHNRLAINDLSDGGKQPLHSPDGTIHAVVNGELYDFEAIKAKLALDVGYKFTNQCDSDIVVALYQTYGLEFFQHLRGEFAFCLYDETKDIFIAARDRYGIKPLFYTIQDGRLLLAAEMKAFLPLGWRPEWDVGSIVESGWNFDDRTLFLGVKKLRPGHYMIRDSSGNVEQRQYWDIEYPEKHIRDDRSEDEIIQGVRERLLDAVRVRLRADVPVGIYLSGGIDSSAIAGMVTHLAKEQGRALGSVPPEDRVSCFCVQFDKTSGFDESDIAERTAEWLGVTMHKQVMDEEAFASRFEDATWHCEQHFFDLSYIGKFALSEVPHRQGFKVVLTGEGADEIFTGYGLFLQDVLREPDLTWRDAMPDDERLRLFAKVEADTSAYFKSIGASDLNRNMTKGRQKLNGIGGVKSMTSFTPSFFEEWAISLHTRHPQDVIASHVPDPVLEKMQQDWHTANTAQYIWSKVHLPNNLLTCLGDRTEMAHSIEGRTPFLDHHLTEYANAIPPSLRMRWKGDEEKRSENSQRGNKLQQNDDFTAKWVLREAVKPFVTQELYERVKHPFSAPVQHQNGGPLHALFGELITEANIRQLGFVSWDKVEDLVRRAFVEGDSVAARLAYSVAQWVVLGRRFGVRRAEERGWK